MAVFSSWAVRIQLGRAGKAPIAALHGTRLLDVNDRFYYTVATKSGNIDIMLPCIIV